MKFFFWFMATLLLLVLVYIWGTGLLILNQQTDLLLVISICASTFSMWGMWYTFLKKYLFLFFFSLGILAFSLWMVYKAMLDVINPVFM